MSWQNDYRMLETRGIGPVSSHEFLPLNEQCFIRKDHKCGKLFGASKSCFIACPTDDDLEPILGLMIEKLTKVGIEPIIAVKERAYGQDIFCTKICGKIIESRFCIVILNDREDKERNIPNPNVYYEYGLMTSLAKHIVPLQKENLKLAFNIQSYDTIKYSSKNIGTELDRAIKDAIRITDAKEQEDREQSLSEKTLLRRLELSGLTLQNNTWFLHPVISDTNFRGFKEINRHFYVYLGKIEDPSEFEEYLEDLGVILHRTERKIKDLETSLSNMSTGSIGVRTTRKEKSFTESQSELFRLNHIYIGFVIQLGVEAEDFIASAKTLIIQYSRYELCQTIDGVISIGDVEVSLVGSMQ